MNDEHGGSDDVVLEQQRAYQLARRSCHLAGQ
jgi:hypothetical protein